MGGGRDSVVEDTIDLAGDMVWEEPPRPKRGRPFDYAEHLLALRSHPQRWARLDVYGAKTKASMTASRLRKSLPDFEFTGRVNWPEEGHSTLWGRYIGAPEVPT